MTIDISNNAARVNYTVASGVTQTSFSVPFEFFNDSDLSVYVDDVLKTITTHYTVSGGDGSTGTITMSVTGAAGGSTVVISRSIAIERTSDFQTGVDINRAALNTQLDTLTAIAADNQDKANRSISAPNSEVNPVLELPDADTRKGKLIGFNETTGNIELSATLADGNTLASISGDIATLADIEDGTEATDAIQTAASISSDITTAASNITEIQNASANAATATTKAAEAATSASNAATSATNASTSETNAATSETNAATSASTATTQAGISTTKATESAASAAAALASENAAATSESNASTSESNASTSATASETSKVASVAAQAAAETAETNAETAQAAAEAAEAAAETAETNAATSETNASTSAATATTQAGIATTKAGEAAASASAASTSEANADTSEANALTYSSNAATSAAAAASSAAGIAGYDLDVIAETKGVTAVDVFVYDTSKDSDGGAWRKRTQGTSWYNETLNTSTRGSRREFPAVAVIVAESNKVTIYDGDDPSLPMWRVTNQLTGTLPQFFRGSYNVTSISARNGGIYWGANIGSDLVTNGVCFLSFAGDYAGRYGANSSHNGVIQPLTEDQSTTAVLDLSLPLIVNGQVNDVAMTVLPNAPIDAATGLPVPTIAVATDGGVSVIKDDGTVWSPTGAGYEGQNKLALSKDNGILHSGRVAGYSPHCVNLNSNSDFATIRGGTNSYFREISIQDETLGYVIGDENRQIQSPSWSGYYQGNGLSLLSLDRSNLENSLVAIASSTYNTGWMPSEIRGAFLSDTDDTDLGGAELVTNGTFDSDTSGWSDTSSAGGSIAWNAAGYLDLDAATATSRASQDIAVTAGSVYAVSVTVVDLDGSISAALYLDEPPSANINLATEGVGTHTIYYVAPDSSLNIGVRNFSTGTTVSLDNISVKLADVDRSVNNKPLNINGTITRSPVATGADLVAYSGFSASNYLEQPYNSDLDFGTGDFCVMGWIMYQQVSKLLIGL